MPRIARDLKKFFDLKRRLQPPCKARKTCKKRAAMCFWAVGAECLFLFFCRSCCSIGFLQASLPRGSLQRRGEFRNGVCGPPARPEKPAKMRAAICFWGVCGFLARREKLAKTRAAICFWTFGNDPGAPSKKVCLIRKRHKIVINTWFGRPLAMTLG